MGMLRLLRRARRAVAKLQVYRAMQPKQRRLLKEAYLFLAWGRLLKGLPFAKIAPRLGAHMEETSDEPLDHKELQVQMISLAIRKMSKYTFWESQCLVQAIAAMYMLHRRKIDCTLYLGMAKEKQGDLAAHAWLRSGNMIVTGEEVMDQFTVVAYFGKQADMADRRGREHERVSETVS